MSSESILTAPQTSASNGTPPPSSPAGSQFSSSAQDATRAGTATHGGEQAEEIFHVEAQNRFDSLRLERRGITSHLKQGNLWQKETLWRDSIVAKLRACGKFDLAEPLESCHSEKSYRICRGCGTARVFWNRCELKHCPICAERLSRERRQTVEWWTKEITQPKHVVLTVVNTDNFSRAYLLWFKKAFAKLRRSKVARNWQGGFYSIECTWKNDAHVHLHALIDAKWIDKQALSEAWAKLVGQDVAIVCVKDARDRSYLAEVSKYVVKGSELASWSGEKLSRFISAIEGVRMFGVFGKLYSLRAELREWLNTLHTLRNKCECGCQDFRVLDDWEWEEFGGKFELNTLPLPPPQPKSPLQMQFTVAQ